MVYEMNKMLCALNIYIYIYIYICIIRYKFKILHDMNIKKHMF